MSYITKTGQEAAKSATAEKVDATKALLKFKSGTSVKVRVPSADCFAEYQSASVFGVFHSTPVLPGNLYAKAADILYKDAKAAKDEKTAEELRNKAHALKPKARYLFGFVTLSDGKPVVVDVSRAQAQSMIAAIEKFAKKLEKTAFELSKTGEKQSTKVSLIPVLDMDEDLTEQERANFEATSGFQFPTELFGEVFPVKTEAEQIADLRAFGFDVSRLGISATTADDDEAVPLDDADMAEPDLGF